MGFLQLRYDRMMAATLKLQRPKAGTSGGEMSCFARLLQFSLVLSFVIVAASATARPRPRATSGGFGAVAVGHDIGCGGSIQAPARVFLSLNYPSREEAERRAITGCQGMGGAGCVVTRTIYPRQCYYIDVSSVTDCRDAWSFGGAASSARAFALCNSAAHSGACPTPSGGCNH